MADALDEDRNQPATALFVPTNPASNRSCPLLRIVSWNCNGLTLGKVYEQPELLRLLMADADVVCFQEARLKHRNVLYDMFPCHDVYCNSDRSYLPGHGLVTIVRKPLAARFISSSMHFLCLELTLPGSSTPHVQVVNSYLPPRTAMRTSQILSAIWSKAADFITRRASSPSPVPSIYVGDFNASYTSAQTRLQTIARQSGLSIKWPAGPTFTNTRGHQSVVDVLMHPAELDPFITLHTHPGTSPSDHTPIVVEMKLPSSSPIHTANVPPFPHNPDVYSVVFNPKVAAPFAASVAHLLSESTLLTHPSTSTAATMVTDLLLHAAREHGMIRTEPPTPFVRRTQRPFSLPRKALDIKECIMTLVQSGTAPNLLRHLRRQFKRLVHKAKLRTSWFRGKVMSDRLLRQPSRFWKPWKQMRAASKASLIPLHTWYTHYANILMATPQAAPEGLDLEPYVKALSPEQASAATATYTAPFTVAELLQGVRKYVNTGAMPGPDLIPAQFFGVSHTMPGSSTPLFPVLDLLCPLFNDILASGTIPTQWQTTVIIPLYKGAGPHDVAGNYRPLSINSALYRFLMCLINRRMLSILEDYHLLPDSQFGFRKHRSCEHAAIALRDSVLCERAAQRPVVAAFLDLTKAYDRVSQPTLISILNLACLPQSLVSLVSSVYTEVACTVHTSSGYTPLLSPKVGLRQGCPLSPTLFNVYIAVASEYLDMHVPHIGVPIGTQSLLKAIFYADDIVLLASSSASLQRLVSALEVACGALNMSINPAKGKSAILDFSVNPIVPPPTITCSAGLIHVEDTYCYLGILFSSNLSWEGALEERCTLAMSKASDLIRYCRQQRVANVRVAATMFTSSVLPCLLWGFPIWGASILTSWDWLSNEFTNMFARVLKETLHLPVGVSHLILTLESGAYPVMYYAIRRFLRFTCRIPLAHSPILDALFAKRTNEGAFHVWDCVLSKFQCPWQAGLNHSLRELNVHFTTLIGALCHDPRDPLCPNRKISSYLTWMWPGFASRRSRFYSMYLPQHIHSKIFRTRLMLGRLPVDVLHKVPFMSRVCPCCAQPGVPCDTQHVFLECPYFAHAREYYMVSNDTSVQDIFCADSDGMYYYVSYVLDLFTHFVEVHP